MNKSFWRGIFPDTRSLLTNALFDKGYLRWQVAVAWMDGSQYEAVVWAKSGERLRDYFQAAKSTLAYVGVNPLPIGPLTPSDVVITDDFLEAWETTQQKGTNE